MKYPLAGKKAKVLYRNPDGSTVLQVEDEHDEILVTVEPDGSMFEERWSGLLGFVRPWRLRALTTRCWCRMMRGGRCGLILNLSWRMNRRPSLSQPLVRRRIAAWIRSTSHRRKSGTRLLPVGCRGVLAAYE